MSLAQLASLLDRVEPDRELWWAGRDESYSARDVASAIDVVRASMAPLYRRRVAVNCHSPVLLATTLVALDGWAAELLLLPPHLPPDHQQAILAHHSIDAVIADQDMPEAPWSCPTVIIQPDAYRQWLAQSGATARAHLPRSSVSTRWRLCTSGTTGVPKQVTHTLETLTRTTKHDLARGREFRWGSLYNLTGFAGLQVFLQSWCAGSALVLQPPDRTLPERVAGLAAGRCNALSATPTMWRKLLMTGCATELKLRRITLGGEVVDQGVLTALRRTFPEARIVHIYASTEAGVGFAVRDGRAGFPASYLEGPVQGVELKVDEGGHLWLRRQAGVSRDASPSDREWIDSRDRVEVRGDRVYFLGRADGTINVGGNKVHPEEVECCLRAHRAVLEVRVTARQSPFTGCLVQADVVADSAMGDRQEDDARVKQELIRWCRERLAPYKVPAVIRIVPTLDVADSGKLRRTA